MITGELKSQIDKVLEAFWTGGLSNPITVIEQMTYLLFIRRLDELQTQKESKANLLKRPIEDPLYTYRVHTSFMTLSFAILILQKWFNPVSGVH